MYPVKELDGNISSPSSKSYTHRYFFIGLLSRGLSLFKNPLKCNDSKASLEAVKKFGADANWNFIKSDGNPKTPMNPIFCGRSGTTCRFATAIAALIKGPTILTGSEQLMYRPMKDLILALKSMGVKVKSNNYHLPITIYGGRIRNKSIEISGLTSSQFISALLLLGCKIGIDIFIKDDLVSKGYIDVTLDVLNNAGIKYYRDDYKYFHVEPSEIRGKLYVIPGDYSSVSYLIGMAAIGGKIKIYGLRRKDPQPDKKIIDIVGQMGAKVIWRNKYIEIRSNALEGIEIDCGDTPDLLPILSVLAAYAKGKTIIKNVGHARFKETDRIKTTFLNLREMGVRVYQKSDGLIIWGGNRRKKARFYSYGDHRIALAFIIASLFLEEKSIIHDIDVINDSYPTFFNDLRSIGVRYELI